METFEWALVLGLAVALIWLWGRRPFHHRGVGISEVSHFLSNLERDADGSRMFIEDEGTRTVITVEKVFSDDSVTVVLVRARAPERLVSDLHDKLQLQDLAYPVRAFEEGRETWVGTEIECSHNQWLYDVRQAVIVFLEWLGSDASSASYHVHFDARPGRHALRKRYERILADPNASNFRREVAARALERLRQRQERRRRERERG